MKSVYCIIVVYCLLCAVPARGALVRVNYQGLSEQIANQRIEDAWLDVNFPQVIARWQQLHARQALLRQLLRRSLGKSFGL